MAFDMSLFNPLTNGAMWLVYGALVSGIIVSQSEMFKKKKQKNKSYVVLGILLVIGLFTSGIVGELPNLAAGDTAPLAAGDIPAVTTPTTTTGDLTFCTVEDTTVTLNDENMFAKGTGVTGDGAHRVFLNGFDKGYIADGGSFTASPGNLVRVLFDENSSSVSTGAYTNEVIVTVPCDGTLDLTGSVCQYDTSPKVTIYNEDGDAMSATVGETMSADSEYTWDFKIRASNNLCAGNINAPGKGNIFCLEYNKTQIDKIEAVSIEGVTTIEKTSAPESISVAATNETSCFYIPAVGDNGIVNGVMVVTTDAAVNPAEDNITYLLFDSDLDLDADTLVTVEGVEDEDDNDLGYGTEAFIAANYVVVF